MRTCSYCTFSPCLGFLIIFQFAAKLYIPTTSRLCRSSSLLSHRRLPFDVPAVCRQCGCQITQQCIGAFLNKRHERCSNSSTIDMSSRIRRRATGWRKCIGCVRCVSVSQVLCIKCARRKEPRTLSLCTKFHFELESARAQCVRRSILLGTLLSRALYRSDTFHNFHVA